MKPVRKWSTGNVVVCWTLGVVWILGCVIAVEFFFGFGRAPGVAAVLGLTSLAVAILLVAVTVRWAVRYPHRYWHPLKLVFLWTLLGIVSVFSVATAQRDDSFAVIVMLVIIPSWIAGTVLTWTWLSAKESEEKDR